MAASTFTPLSEFILKMHTSCNLACDYCYMYELSDKSYAGRVSAAMSAEVVGKVAERVAVHVERYDLTSVRIVFHGGEPMLVGPARLAEAAGILRAAIPAAAEIVVQTNGVLINPAALDTLAAAGVKVGVSVDGGAEAQDRHRRFRNGRGSWAAVDRGLRLLAERREIFAGVLTVVDPANDPVEVYEAVLAYAPPALDIMLPHHTWQDPPPRAPGGPPDEYGRWLARLFDRWAAGPPEENMRVRLFEELLSLILGRPSRTEALGLSPVAALVIDVDGTIEQVDTLRVAFPGAVETGLNVFRHDLEAAQQHRGVRARQQGRQGLCLECQECPVYRVCGGGYYPHRYKPETGFDNPSVFCADLKYLIGHVSDHLAALRP